MSYYTIDEIVALRDIAARWLRLCNRDYKQFNQLRLNYYNNLVKVHAKLARYLKGWTNRVNSLNLYLTTIK